MGTQTHITFSMQLFLLTFSFAPIIDAATVPPAAIAKVEAVFQGVVKGFAGAEVPELDSCVSGLESSYEDFSEAVHDFEEKTASGVLDGLEATAHGLEALVTGLKACNATAEEVQTLIAGLKQFNSPTKFAIH